MNIITDYYTSVIFIGAIMVIEFKEYRKKIKKGKNKAKSMEKGEA